MYRNIRIGRHFDQSTIIIIIIHKHGLANKHQQQRIILHEPIFWRMIWMLVSKQWQFLWTFWHNSLAARCTTTKRQTSKRSCLHTQTPSAIAAGYNVTAEWTALSTIYSLFGGWCLRSSLFVDTPAPSIAHGHPTGGTTPILNYWNGQQRHSLNLTQSTPGFQCRPITGSLGHKRNDVFTSARHQTELLQQNRKPVPVTYVWSYFHWRKLQAWIDLRRVLCCNEPCSDYETRHKQNVEDRIERVTACKHR